MPPLLLLLPLLLAPLGAASAQDGAAKGAAAPALSRRRRQVTLEDDSHYESEDYYYYTDPPETLPTLGRLRAGSEGPGSPEPPTVEASKELVTRPSPVTVDMVTELSSVTVSTTETPFKEGALSMQPAATEAETTQPAATEAETTQPIPTEAETMQPAPMEAETTQPAPTEAETTQPIPTEAETTQSAPTEAETTQPIPTEAETTQPTPMEAETTQPAPTEAETTQPAPTEAETTEASPTITFLGHSVIRNDTTVAASNLSSSGLKKELAVPTGSSVAPTPTEALGRIPVKQCLLAILILALVATIFLVCTVVLAVRLSRMGHTYPVRSYSPTEMVCISSLLPDGGEGATATANGGVSRGRDLKAERREDREGDDLTLHSFLP
ncbi:PREDICTED: P-selectin glycoprotein ligand 1 isoform X3 [Chinchilla lanigera]|uniref:P-selectin glycoprotein ligand 1 isoform X3 n=1 Tax=Chinchilla lanigera TaxID=34839 RepID=UPI00038EBA6D|nr:PREDICTED: P-selectin glycoprotein ligand 1 isoform X3 [Chinchilla lanigera]